MSTYELYALIQSIRSTLNDVSTPDYEEMLARPRWEDDEAAALSLGLSLDQASEIEHHPDKDDKLRAVTRLFRKRWSMIGRATWTGALSSPPSPKAFLAWAREVGMSLPAQLVTTGALKVEAEIFGGVDPKASAQGHDHATVQPDERDSQRAEREQFLQRISELEKLLDEIRSEIESLNPKRLITLYRIILGLAVDKFHHVTDGNSKATTNIASALERQDLRVTDDTIREVLSDCVRLLDKHFPSARN